MNNPTKPAMSEIIRPVRRSLFQTKVARASWSTSCSQVAAIASIFAFRAWRQDRRRCRQARRRGEARHDTGHRRNAHELETRGDDTTNLIFAVAQPGLTDCSAV